MSSCRYHAPYPIYTTLLSASSFPPNVGYRPRLPPQVADILRNSVRPDTPPGTLKSRIMQTMFRESEAQTDPYEVDIYPPDPGLEILTLGWLSWNNGLPAGMREVIVIERARQKRAWEKALPKPVNDVAREIRDMILAAIEINEWTYREVEMAALGSIRLELAAKCMAEELAANREEYLRKTCRYAMGKVAETLTKIEGIQRGFHRELRQLLYRERGINRRYFRWNVIRELSDKTSEFYGPQTRFGVNPRRGNEVIPACFAFRNVFSGLEVAAIDELQDKPKPKFDIEARSKPRNPERSLCIHETKWTLSNLQVLSEALSSYSRQKSGSEEVPRRTRIPVPPPEYVPPAREQANSDDDEEEDAYQASLYLQKTIRGRAIQTVMFDGRVKCQELLDELKSTHALQSCWEDLKQRSRQNVYDKQREADIEALKNKRKKEIQESLVGKTVAETLDFLAKELLRLQNERLTHAYALIADMERNKREAEEAGRRQKEEQRRRELDEIYKQLMKVYQNSTDLVHEAVYLQAKSDYASHRARAKAEALARKIDQAAQAAHMHSNKLHEEELVAELVYNFALPEAEKMIIRKRIHDRQAKMVEACHDVVYCVIENTVESNRTRSGRLQTLPRQLKHKLPPLVPVKFLRLRTADVDSEASLNASAASDDMIQFQRKMTIYLDKPPRDYFLDAFPGIRPSDIDQWSTGFSPQGVIIE